MKAVEGNVELSTGAPKPIRSLENLTTTPSVINFNHDSQMMVTASAKKKDALKVVGSRGPRGLNSGLILQSLSTTCPLRQLSRTGQLPPHR